MLFIILQRGTPFSGPIYTGPVNNNQVSKSSPEEILILIVAIILFGAFILSFNKHKK
ncbi:hypothetical protein [Tenacibaculum aiptasiae]|uniref:hypothetical protein n=1 Tax=Tenacibaculum aiptasiae TaxID=426481 RepID=UPI00232D3DDB|nr:hypothetical protein [Tenacibaculum aiptasiae]